MQYDKVIPTDVPNCLGIFQQKVEKNGRAGKQVTEDMKPPPARLYSLKSCNLLEGGRGGKAVCAKFFFPSFSTHIRTLESLSTSR